MSNEIIILGLSAISIAFVHTIMGPDHYLPFVMIARARSWSRWRTTWITALCGIGHVLSSIVLGVIGVGFGVAVTKLKILEAFRGTLAAWMLIIFGLCYAIYGLKKAGRGHVHAHWHKSGVRHFHPDGSLHTEPVPDREEETVKTNITPWILFAIFVFGPCEPLIPLLIYPAAQSSLAGLIMVISVFAIVTICTMLVMVNAILSGVRFIPLQRVERYMHALAGFVIMLSGIAIQFLGL